MLKDSISIIITALNEREWLLRTVASIYSSTQSPFEIIVIDDESNDGTDERLFREYPQILYHRNPERIGLIRSRILGTALAKGNYYVFMDAHCKPEKGWDITLIKASKEFKDRAIVSPCIPVLDITTWNNCPEQSGYAMTFNKRLDMKWCPKPTPVENNSYIESAIYAGCVCLIAKEFYHYLQGFDEGLTFWGCENIDLSLRCWMLGGKVIVATAAKVGHMFKSTFNYSISKEIIISNKLRIAGVNFSEERFRNVVNAFSVVKELPPGLFPVQNELAERRNHVLTNRVFHDNWVVDRFNIQV